MATTTEPQDVADLGSIFVDPGAYADPVTWHAAASRIRAESPLLKVSVEGYPEFWAVTTHADVMEVERHPDIFTNAPLPVLTPSSNVAAAAAPPVKTLIQMDGEEHKSHRNIVNDWFKPGSVKKLQDRVDELARASVDRMAAVGGQCDFVNDIAVHFPLQVILAILGLPEKDYPRMLKLTQELFGAEDPDIARLGEDASMVEVVLDFVKYFTALAEDRRAHPTEDLASVIANAQIDGTPLPDMDTFGFYLIIATAGHDTTSNVIGGALVALLDHPDQLALLQAEPQLVNQAADELIRYVTPVKHFLRTCQEPFALRNVTIQPGELVLLSFASANRDESVFPDPHRLDVRRASDTNHVAFGFGRHFCLGAHLARMEIRSFYRELLGRLEHIELAGEPTWIRANFVEGPKSVPVSYRLR
ncbi:MAG TPA: cytochrome P450 [Acidimicrobiales bacterium]|nr:cytochrome P450 [Acidimicrobiales bacterium]